MGGICREQRLAIGCLKFKFEVYSSGGQSAVDAKYEEVNSIGYLHNSICCLAYIYAVSISVQTEVCDAISEVSVCVDGVRGGVWLGSISH